MNAVLRASLSAFLLASASAFAQPVEPVLAQVKAQKQPPLDTLRDLTSIESGSRDIEPRLYLAVRMIMDFATGKAK